MTNPATLGRDRPWDAVTRTIDANALGIPLPRVAAVAALGIGSWLAFLAAAGRDLPVAILLGVLGGVASGLVAAFANAYARPARARRAIEAFVWLGEWELDRVARLGIDPIRSPTSLQKFVETVPERAEDRWLRVEELGRQGRLADARAMAERMPGTTPYDRVERVAALTWIDWLSGGDGDPAPLRAEVVELRPVDGEERLRAEVILACAELRHRLARGGADPIEPLLTARDRLGVVADDVLLKMTRRAAPAFVPVAIVSAGILIAIGRIAGG